MRRARDWLGPKFSEGARLLWIAASKDGEPLVIERVREALKVRNRGTVNRWLYGDRTPSSRAMLAIERAFKVPIKTWHQPPRRPFVIPDDALAAA